MVSLTMTNGTVLDFWVDVDENNTVATVWVQQHGDHNGKKYRVFSISHSGECWRHAGLPDGWGFRLTADRKIKEVM